MLSRSRNRIIAPSWQPSDIDAPNRRCACAPYIFLWPIPENSGKIGGVKILLIQTPSREPCQETLVVPPLGLAYLAAVARQAGHTVAILDAFAEGLTWDAFEARVRSAQADLIGITGMTPVADSVQRAIRICRPQARWLVLGGPLSLIHI